MNPLNCWQTEDVLFVPLQTPYRTPPPRSPSPACCEEEEAQDEGLSSCERNFQRLHPSTRWPHSFLSGWWSHDPPSSDWFILTLLSLVGLFKQEAWRVTPSPSWEKKNYRWRYSKEWQRRSKMVLPASWLCGLLHMLSRASAAQILINTWHFYRWWSEKWGDLRIWHWSSPYLWMQSVALWDCLHIVYVLLDVPENPESILRP